MSVELFELLASVARDLETQGVPYALTGSVASSLYGRPRASLDADIVLRMTPAEAVALARIWKGNYYASVEGLQEAARQGTMTNLIDGASGLKIDLSVLASGPFNDSVLARRRQLQLPGGQQIWAVSPEDVVLMKLVWRKDSRSQRQYDDARGVVQVLGPRLDWLYLREWADRLGLAADLRLLETDGSGPLES